MKLIIAFVKPFTLDEVRDALEEAGVSSFSFREVRGFGHHKGDKDIYRGVEYAPSYVPMMEVIVAVKRDLAAGVVAAIAKAANTGEPGDGKIFAMDISEATDISSGQSGPDVL